MSDLIPCIIRATDDTGHAAASPVHVNGKNYPIAYNKRLELPAEAIQAVRDSSLFIELLPVEGEEPTSPGVPAGADAAAAGDPGGDAGGGAAFDPEQVIVGNIPDIEQSLATLTPVQLALVEAAEINREKPRKGVIELIAKARSANTPTED